MTIPEKHPKSLEEKVIYFLSLIIFLGSMMIFILSFISAGHFNYVGVIIITAAILGVFGPRLLKIMGRWDEKKFSFWPIAVSLLLILVLVLIAAPSWVEGLKTYALVVAVLFGIYFAKVLLYKGFDYIKNYFLQ